MTSGPDYPDYIGCHDDEIPLSSAFYNFIPMTIREYINRGGSLQKDPFSIKDMVLNRKKYKDSVIIKSMKQFLLYENDFPKYQYFRVYGSGPGNGRIAMFSNGMHEFTVACFLNCYFGKEIPGSDMKCVPDNTRISWHGKIAQRFKLIKTDSTYFIKEDI